MDDILVDTWVYTVEEVSELATRYLGAWGVIRLGYSFRLNKRMRLQFQFPFLWSDQPLPLFGSFANLYSRKFAETALQIYGYQNGKITKFPDTRKPYQVDVGLITGTLQDAGLQQAIVFPQMFTVDVLEWLTQTNLRSPLGLSADDEIAFGNVDGLNVLSRLATVYNGSEFRVKNATQCLTCEQRMSLSWRRAYLRMCTAPFGRCNQICHATSCWRLPFATSVVGDATWCPGCSIFTQDITISSLKYQKCLGWSWINDYSLSAAHSFTSDGTRESTSGCRDRDASASESSSAKDRDVWSLWSNSPRPQSLRNSSRSLSVVSDDGTLLVSASFSFCTDSATAVYSCASRPSAWRKAVRELNISDSMSDTSFEIEREAAFFLSISSSNRLTWCCLALQMSMCVS